MYTVTIPVMIRAGFQAEETLAELKRSGTDRVLLALPRSMKRTAGGFRIDTDAFMDVLRELIPRYEAAGLEVGVWLGETMGHGMGAGRGDYVYQPFVNILGHEANGGFCCADGTFRADVTEWAANAAGAGAKLIVLDDDWRMNAHGAGIFSGCMCPDHVKRYAELAGEDLGREEIVRRTFTGGPSRYRDLWRSLMGGDMLRLAREIREAVDRVNPDCRVGICTAPSVVGKEGADFMQIADALAGKTRPWVRLIGAPYWAKNGADLAAVMTLERRQAHMAERWRDERDAEILLEGDVYPRPRFVCPSAYLECADQIARADRQFTGAMKYMMDYTSSPRYEHGYIDRHVKNAALGREIERLFPLCAQTGFVPLEAADLFRHMNFGEGLSPEEADASSYEDFRGIATRYLCGACVPVSFDAGVPVVFGENARLVGSRWHRVEYGAVLDAVSAQILTEKGWDVGAASFGEAFGAKSPETFLETGEIVPFSGHVYRRIVPKAGAEVLTRFSDGSPAAFRYENRDGGRFLVYPIIASSADTGSTYFRSYERHRELMAQGRWIGEAYPEGIRFPADCAGNPDLYMITTYRRMPDGHYAGQAGLWNLFPDAVEEPVIELDAEPEEVRYVNCTGEVSGRTVRLSRIEPFGFAGISYTGTR